MTGAELARLFDYTRGAITRMVSRGVLHKTAGGKFDVIESIASVMNDREERLVKRYGKGERAAVDTEIRKEHLAFMRRKREAQEGEIIADAVEALGPFVIACRNKMLGIPVRYAPQLVNLRSPAEAQKILEPPIRDALNELAEAQFRWKKPAPPVRRKSA